MHILISSAYALPLKGGIQVVCENLARLWHEAGHRVTQISSDSEQPDEINRPWQRIYVPALNPVDPYIIPFPLFNPWRLNQQFRDLLPSVDVVNIQGILYQNNMMLSSAASRANIPVVLTEYPGIVPYDSPIINLVERIAFDTLARYTARHSDYFVYHNREVERSLRHYFRPGIQSQQIKVGVDTTHFHPISQDERQQLRDKWRFTKPTLLFAGRHTPRKGSDWLTMLDHDAFDIVICGARQSELNTRNSRVQGYVPDEDLLELYRACDAFLMFTSGRDFPLVGLEAMAAGLPIICFDNPANREYHSDETAIFVEEAVESILEGISGLINHPEKQAQMAKAARERAIQYFDWYSISEQYLSLFEQAISTKTGR